MNAGTESAVRAAMALCAEYQSNSVRLDAAVQRDILAEVWVRNDQREARRERDAALVRAFILMGRLTPVRLIHEMLMDFDANAWPGWRLTSKAPHSATALQRELFEACRAAYDGAIGLPCERQLRRILIGHCTI